MAATKKSFDAVQMMRSIRDTLSEQIKGMTFEEERNYIRKRLREENVEGTSGTDTGETGETGHAGQAPEDMGKS